MTEKIALGEGLSINVDDNYESDNSTTEISWKDVTLFQRKRIKLVDKNRGITVDIKVKVYRFKKLFEKEAKKK